MRVCIWELKQQHLPVEEAEARVEPRGPSSSRQWLSKEEDQEAEITEG